jgi:lambda repressor-like predicted transcriptional regulator
MSDPSPEKWQRDKQLTEAFLQPIGFAYSSLERGSDPPDVSVKLRDSLMLHVELTDYHPNWDRVGLEKRSRSFRQLLDQLICSRESLKGVFIRTVFKDERIPSERLHLQIGEEVIRVAESMVNQGWANEVGINVSFTNQDMPTSPHIFSSWCLLAKEESPILFKSINTIHVSSFEFSGYLPCAEPFAQAAYCSPYPEAFLDLLTKKEQKMRNAELVGSYVPGLAPLWLLIVCNNRGDLSSEIFGSEWLQESVEECGFDFQGSAFNEFWLMRESGGVPQRLHPWVVQ